MVKARGNSSSVTEYSYMDEKPMSGISYYRLKMVDLDGSSGYSSIVVITISDPAFNVYLQQNPLQDEIKVLVNSPIKEILYYRLTDAAGREYIKGHAALNQGMNSIRIGTHFLLPGMYILSTYTPHASRNVKLLKQ
jgi:hypothetical protein